MMKRIFVSLVVVLALIVSGIFWYGNQLGSSLPADIGRTAGATEHATDLNAEIVRGAYLARAGNCMGCHTTRGGDAYAGGRMIASEFGDFVSPNITPDKKTGIGNWTFNDFWNALHNGKSKDGRLLYPAFPYPSYTQISAVDAQALFAFFQSIPAVERKNQPHALRTPYDQRGLLAFWRALYFKPGEYQPQPAQTVEWNRGAYLVKGLAHCGACHTSRNALGASDLNNELGGAYMPVSNWYAPSLLAQDEAGVQTWSAAQLSHLLRDGISVRAHASGPMAEVVASSLQYLSDSDIQAMTVYLQSLPKVTKSKADLLDQALAGPAAGKEEMERIMYLGGALYKFHCIDCHGDGGRGAPPAYPALQGNAALQMTSAANPVRMVLAGGFPAATKGNPRPYGMPPFAPTLSDTEVALVISYVRNSWGNKAPVIGASEVNRYRTAPLD
ncbi:c-type cytochrome [Undibacterium sp. RuTC16W]|uniref:c-type cytochrome n=1 Tax=Undibacterium sp. RuTC16W TaxID=3413048 RepID=UPI003BF13DBE